MVQLKLEDNINSIGAITGIYSDLPAFRLCYFLNNHLNFRLVRSHQDYSVKNTLASYNFLSFEYFDEERELLWQLVENKSIEEESPAAAGLFSSTAQRARWISSNENYDYFLWFDAEEGARQTQKALLEALAPLPYVKASATISGKLYQKILKLIN